MDQLVTRGRVVRGWLGVAVQDGTSVLARAPSPPGARGVLVADVVPDGPASRASLRPGDVIAAVDGTPVNEAGRFRNLVAATPPGTTVRLTIVRNGREQTVEVAVGERPERTAVERPR
jgi:S1-C subfamily serine protease